MGDVLSFFIIFLLHHPWDVPSFIVAFSLHFILHYISNYISLKTTCFYTISYGGCPVNFIIFCYTIHGTSRQFSLHVCRDFWNGPKQ